jgi:hypothetical protein
MYYRASIFDLVVPRLLAGERLGRRDIVEFGHGGFCADAPTVAIRSALLAKPEMPRCHFHPNHRGDSAC